MAVKVLRKIQNELCLELDSWNDLGCFFILCYLYGCVLKRRMSDSAGALRGFEGWIKERFFEPAVFRLT